MRALLHHTPSIAEKPRRRHVALLCLLCAVSTLLPLFAQTRKGPAPPPAVDVLRAVSVYEWTGDLAKPTAARVVPVSLFIDHQFQDAALYLSRPMPLALEPGNIYELESAGVKQGDVTLVNAARNRNENATTSFDEGWFAYGTFKPVVIPKPYVPDSLVTNAHIITSGEGRPHFGKTPDATTPASTTAQTPAQTTPPPTAQNAPPQTSSDPNRPILHHTAPGDPQQTAPATTDTSPTTAQTPPVLAPAPANPPASSTPAAANPSTPAQTKPDNPSSTNADRPTFPRPTSGQQPSSGRKKSQANSASVTDAGGLLGDDPGRPHLHHGGATTAAALPALHGLPADMRQMVAVSDAADRPEHNFAYEWPDDAAKSAMMTKLEALARAALPAPAAPPAAHSHTRKAAPPPQIVLLDEQLHAYEISYGGVDVFVFSAHVGDGPTLQNVTLLAQLDIYGALHVLLQSVTGAIDLDQHPQMRFLDAVDADGDNRAELLFELRGETQRQFALYRIVQGTATQDFVTGTMQ